MKKKSHFIFIIFCAFFLIGVSVYKDYGLGTDEYINRTNGEISYNYVANVISNLTNKKINNNDVKEARQILDNYRDRDYGVAFDLPVMAIEKFLKLDSSKEKYLLRHGLTHLLFLFALFYFYNIIFKRFNSQILGIIAVSLVYINPRIFAESFYNNKDIVFMSLFIIALYYSIELIKKQSFKNCILAAVTTALAIDSRIIGVMLPGVVLVAWLFETIKNYKNIDKNRIILFGIVYLIALVFFTIIFWPWLWIEPVDHFIEAFKNMAKFRWLNWVVYRGHSYVSTDLPWHYLPVWISITTPVVYLGLFLYGNIVIIKRTVLYKFNLYYESNELIDLAVAALFLVPLFAVVILKSTIYDGWRQFYFLYPSLIYISIIGLNKLLKSKIKIIIVAILIFEVILTGFWIIKNHPYQYVFFNKLGGEDIAKNYEMDYWGVTNVDAIKKILNFDKRDYIKVYGLGNTSIPQAFLLLDRLDAKRIHKTIDINEADYVITNFRFLNSNKAKAELDKIEDYFNIFFAIEVDNNIIGLVYKRVSN